MTNTVDYMYIFFSRDAETTHKIKSQHPHLSNDPNNSNPILNPIHKHWFNK